MLTKILPQRITNALNKFNNDNITEIRLRVDKPVLIYVGNKCYFLGDNGLFNTIGNSIKPTKTEVEDVVFRASKCSIYSNNEKIKKGYLTLENGIRLGICGDVIYENSTIKTISNFSSVNIRIPKQCKYCSSVLFKAMYDCESIKNTLIIAPPGAGKTTFLRDLCYLLSENDFRQPISIIDERGELSPEGFDLGDFCDVLTFANKSDGIEQAIRTLNPSVIMCDEIGNQKDSEVIEKAFNSGVKIVTTIHSAYIEELKNKNFMKAIIQNEMFDLYCLLSKKEKIGTIEGIYNSKFNRVG